MVNFQADKIESWSKGLGLLPIQLFSEGKSTKQFILLNGSNGNFCIDTNPSLDVERARDYAWSSNSGHFVDLSKDHVNLHRWDLSGQSAVEKIQLKYVSENLEKFYKYLIKSQPGTENSIVNYTIRSFRKLKYSLRRDANPSDALKAFLVLLASVTDNSSLAKINKTKWGLTAKDIEIAKLVSKLDWEALQEELLTGIKYFNLKPDFSLAIRHSSGKLFQEAHYESLFVNPAQLSFEGMLIEAETSKIKTPSVGVHYTPSSIVRTIVEESFYFYGLDKKKEITILDPACGSGEFLRESLRQLKAKGFSGKVKLIGWDLSPAAIDMARFVISFEMRDWDQKKVEYDLQIQDSLNTSFIWPNNIDIVLMNPPFLSWENMNGEQRGCVEYALNNLKEKRPDYSSAFIYKASESISKGGVLAAIIPASFLSGDSNKKIREDLKDRLSTLLLGRLGSQLLFTDALVDSAIYIAKNDTIEKTVPTTLWADVHPDSASAALRTLRKLRVLDDNKAVIDQEGFSIYKDKLVLNSTNWTPRSYKSFKISDRLKKYSRVKESFNIQQGIRTGYNPVFILEKNYFSSLPLKEKEFFRPCVINKSIVDGKLMDDFYVFFPYDENGEKITSEDELKKYLKTYYTDKLKPNKKILEKRKGINPSKWWELTRHRTWQVSKNPKIISTYFGSAGSFAFDKTGEFAIVQGFGWTPKSKRNIKVDIYYAYLAILHSNFIDELLSTVANQVSGGQYELSKRYISEMPFPNLFEKSTDASIKTLSAIGRRIEAGEEIDQLELDKLVELLFSFK